MAIRKDLQFEDMDKSLSHGMGVPDDMELALVRQVAALRSELTSKELELRRAKTELDLLRSLYSDFYESSPVGYLTVDRNGQIIEANIRCSEMLGVKREAICGTNLLLLAIDELREAARLFLRNVFESGGFQRCKLKLKRGQGAVFQALLDGMPIRAGSEKLSQCRVAITDITERERVERLLHIQRDLSRELSTVFDLKTAASCLLESCLRIEDVDCGLFYVVDAGGDSMKLIAYQGLKDAELPIESDSFDRGTRLFQIVIRGSPSYLEGDSLMRIHELEFFSKAGIRTLCAIPVHYEGSPVACLVLASRRLDEIPSVSRAALESIATETGSVFIRIKMDSALRESEQRLRGIMDNASSLIYVKDMAGRYALVNEQFAQLFKMSKESFEGLTCQDIFPPGAAEEFLAHDKEVLCSRKPVTFEETYRFPSGTRIFLVTKFPLFDKDGNPCGVCGIDMDITQRKRAEDRLRTSEERLRTVADFTYAWEYWVGPSGEFLYISPSVERITGHKPQDFIANPGLLPSIVHPDDRERVVKTLKESLRSPEVHKSEFRIVRPDGEIRWIGHVCQPVHSSSGDFLGRRGSNDDITDRKAADEALGRALEAAESANRVKSQFIANLSHEIRTPMNAIIGFTDLVLTTPLSEHQKKCLAMVKARGEDLLIIISDILDISRIESGKMQLALAHINLKEIVRDIVRSFHHEASKKSVSISAKVSEEVPSDLMGDPVRIRQILVNLVGNSIKFTERGSILLSLACAEKAGPDGLCTVLFTVSDTGIGIPKDKQTAIFDAFTQADSSTVRKFGGTGLGLAICSKLVNMMDGRIWVESDIGKGSSFFFTAKLSLPKRPDQEKPCVRLQTQGPTKESA